MIKTIKKLFNKQEDIVLCPGVYPISIEFYKANIIGYRAFKFEYCVIDENERSWPSIQRIVDEVNTLGWYNAYKLPYDYRHIISDYIQDEFKLRKAKGELE